MNMMIKNMIKNGAIKPEGDSFELDMSKAILDYFLLTMYSNYSLGKINFSEYDSIVSLDLGSVPLGSVLSYRARKPQIVLHGEILEGCSADYKKPLLVNDVFYAEPIKRIEIIKENNMEVNEIYSWVDMSNKTERKTKLKYLISRDDILKTMISIS